MMRGIFHKSAGASPATGIAGSPGTAGVLLGLVTVRGAFPVFVPGRIIPEDMSS